MTVALTHPSSLPIYFLFQKFLHMAAGLNYKSVIHLLKIKCWQNYLPNSLAGVKFKNLTLHTKTGPLSGWIRDMLLVTQFYVQQGGMISISCILYSSQTPQLGKWVDFRISYRQYFTWNTYQNVQTRTSRLLNARLSDSITKFQTLHHKPGNYNSLTCFILPFSLSKRSLVQYYQ